MTKYILSKKGRIVNREAGYDYSKSDVITAEEFKKITKTQKVFFTEADEDGTAVKSTTDSENEQTVPKYEFDALQKEFAELKLELQSLAGLNERYLALEKTHNELKIAFKTKYEAASVTPKEPKQ